MTKDKTNLPAKLPALEAKGLRPTAEPAEFPAFVLSRGETIVREMAMAGFSKKTETASKHYAEFQRIYTEAGGANGMCTALVKVNETGEPEVLEGFVLTIQKHVRATPEDIKERAWNFAKSEMEHLVSTLGGPDEVAKHVSRTRCTACGKPAPEFVETKGGKRGKDVLKLCPECHAKAKEAKNGKV